MRVGCVQALLILCAGIGKVAPLSYEEGNIIVNQHNRFRRMVANEASNMQMMFWDEGLAASAQSYADQCNFHHSQIGWRNGAGENIGAATYPSFYGFTEQWFVEWRCGCRRGCCGHYTQVAWARTNRIGCGNQYCPNGVYGAPGMTYVFVCHYSPPGNIRGRGAFRQGPTCSHCPGHAPACYDGLCVPHGYFD